MWLETTKGLKDSSSTEGDRTKNGSRGLNSSSYEAANMARHSHPHLVRLSPYSLSPVSGKSFKPFRVFPVCLRGRGEHLQYPSDLVVHACADTAVPLLL